MQRKQLLGIILFAIGGGLGFFSFAYSVLFVETTYGLSSGIRTPFLSVPFAESLAISIGVGFVPFLLMGLGLYFIFQPYFSTMQRVAEAIEEREEAAIQASLQKAEADNKEPEIPQLKGNDDLKKLNGSELQQELIKMKTIEHVLSSRQKKADSQPDQMTDMLSKTHERIAAIELEIWNRQRPKAQP